MFKGGEKLNENAKERLVQANGHNLVERTYFKSTYCHHCKKLLWGFRNQATIPNPFSFIFHHLTGPSLFHLHPGLP